MKYFYVETDGQVYLVERGGLLCFPESEEEFPFEIYGEKSIRIDDREVVYCSPRLSCHPYDWWHKDEIPSMNEVDPLVRKAVNTTLPRVVTEAIIKKGDNILLVKPKRGFTKGNWTLPGGFGRYGETPKESLLREVKEEVGVEGEIGELLTVESRVGIHTGFHWFMFFYEVSLPNEEFDPSKDEIEAVKWFDLKDTIINLGDGIMGSAIKKLYG